jgi:OOP family OmpA-OmpF porin
MLKVAKDNEEVWAAIEAGGNGIYKVNIIVKQQMNQEVAANAKILAGSIKDTGKVVVYGIYFDTDKAEIKVASEPAIAEIEKKLKANQALKLYVVGHTDNAGSFNHNIRLSQDRAAAVVKALVSKYGIEASRLTPYGDGRTAPVASNKNEEARSKNRRVELVAQ